MYFRQCRNHRQQNKCYFHRSLYYSISKLHSILSVANLLAHNNTSQICYCGQISLQSVNCCFSDELTALEVTFILLVIVHYKYHGLINSIIITPQALPKVNLLKFSSIGQFSFPGPPKSGLSIQNGPLEGN